MDFTIGTPYLRIFGLDSKLIFSDAEASLLKLWTLKREKFSFSVTMLIFLGLFSISCFTSSFFKFPCHLLSVVVSFSLKARWRYGVWSICGFDRSFRASRYPYLAQREIWSDIHSIPILIKFINERLKLSLSTFLKLFQSVTMVTKNLVWKKTMRMMNRPIIIMYWGIIRALFSKFFLKSWRVSAYQDESE